MRHAHTLLLLPLFLGVVTCGGEGQLPSPTLRVDLRHKLPKLVLRRLLAVDTTYECSKEVTLHVPEASQRFILSWRVFDYKAARHITAVQVAPSGPARGASGPKASATVGQPATDRGITTVPIQVFFSGRAGCSGFTVARKVNLRSNDPTCKQPTSKVRIWKDSKQVEPSKPAAGSGDAAPASAPAAEGQGAGAR